MNLRPLISLPLLVGVFWLPAPGQVSGGSVSGRVTLAGDGAAVGAVVLLEETKLGAAVDGDGRFLIAGVPPGRYRVIARLVGYRPTENPLVLVEEGRTVPVEILLRQSAVEMTTVTVTGSRRQEASDVRASVTSMTPRESKILPGAAEDVLRSLQALPGVTSVSDFSSQLVVRGSGPDQNLIMIDQFEVLNPYRLYGFVSMFNPETVSDIALQTGGFAALYGDRLSAVLDVRNREGRTDVTVGGKINASLTNLNLILEGAIPVAGASYLLSLRRTYYDLILGPVLKSAKLVEGDVALPNFRDLQAKVSVPLGENHKLLLQAIGSRDGVSLMSGSDRTRPDSVSVFDSSFNTLLGATWQYSPSSSLLFQTHLSWYRNDGSGMFDGSFVDPSQNTGSLGRADTLGIRFLRFGVTYDYIYQKVSLAQRVLWDLGSHTLEAGVGGDALRTDFIRFFEIDPVFAAFIRSRGQVVPSDMREAIHYNRFHVFAQDRISLGDRLFVQPGVRADFYPLLRTSLVVSPRLNISYKLDDLSTLRAAVGVYYQSPGMEKQDMRSRVTFTRDAFTTLVPERADHYILGYDRMLTPAWQWKAEAYFKRFADVIAPQKLQGSRWWTVPTGGDPFARAGWTVPVRVAGDSLTPFPVNGATGRSYGFELLLQKIRSLPEDRFTGWVSYALSYAERERDGLRTPFLFDQRHAANVVGNYRFAERWDLGFRYTLRSGRPFSRALRVTPRVVIETIGGVSQPVVQLDTKGRVILDADYERETTTGRLTMYHALDLRITTYPRWWGLDWAVYLDVQNVTNRSNQQQINYYIDDAGQLRERPINGIPIFPSFGFSLTF